MIVRNEPLPVLIGNGARSPRYIVPLVPNRWMGQENCVVGPFSSKEVAENFANYRVTFGQYESYHFEIFAQGDAWYVEVLHARAKVASVPRIVY